MNLKSTEVKTIIKKKEEPISLTLSSQERSTASSNLNNSSYFSRDSNILFANKSLCFGNNNKFRYIIQRIITTKIFIRTMDILIILNTFFLILETIDKYEIYSDYYHDAFTLIFLLECILKIIALGFFMEDNSYLRDPWNWLDFIIVITGILYFIPHLKANVNSLKGFRLLRPLKSISSFPSMRKFINSLVNCLYDLIDIIIILFFIIFFFGLLGYAIFDNRYFFVCRSSLKPIYGDLPIDPLYNNHLCGGEVTCGGKNEFCLSTWDFYYDGRYFIPEDFPYDSPNLHENSKKKSFSYGLTNFNNVLNSIFVIIMVATAEGWMDLMMIYMDGYNYYISFIYFFFCLVIIHYFMLNLITALLLYNFNKEKDEAEISISVVKRGKKKKNKILMAINDENLTNVNPSLNNSSSIYSKGSESKINVNLNINAMNLANNQEMNKMKRKYKRINFNRNIKRTTNAFYIKIINSIKDIKMFKKVKRLSSYHKKSTFGYYCYVIISQPIVEKFFFLCIILNSIVFAFERKGISKKERRIHEKLNIMFVALFILEIIIEIFAYSPKEYFNKGENIWDFIIVGIAFIEIIMIECKIISQNTGAVEESILTCMRIIRVFKIFRKWESFSIILDSIRSTMIRMIDFLFIFFIFLFIFTLLGYSFFHDSIRYKDGEYFAQATAEYYNFDSFINSLVSVIIIIIGDHWIDLLFDCYRSGKNSKVEVILYYLLVVLFGQIIIMKIFLAYLIEQFDIAKKHYEKNYTIHNFLLDLIYYSTSKNINSTSNKKPIDSQIEIYLKAIEHIKPNYFLSESPFELLNKVEINFITREKKKQHIIQRNFSEHVLRHGGYYEEIGNMKIFNFDDVLIKQTNNIQVELFYNDELDKIDFYELSEYNLTDTENLENSNSEKSYNDNDINTNMKNKNRFSNLENIVIEEENENEIDNPIKTNDSFLKNISQDNEIPSIKENDYDIVSTVNNEQKSSNKTNNRSILSSFAASRNLALNSLHSLNSKNYGLFSIAPEYSFDEDSINNSEKSSWEKFYNYISKASCFIIGKNWKIRKKIHDFVYCPAWSYIVFVLIVTNTILICFDNPWLDPKSKFAKFSKRANQCYTSIFLCNTSLKMISDGIIFNKNAYLRNIINLIDFFCLCIGFLGFFNIATEYRYLRALRSIKPIRILIRSENLSLMMETIIASIPSMINLIFFIFLYIYTFTLLGLSIFKGKLEYVCITDFTLQNEEECINIGGNWIFNRENYANFFYGLKSTFELILKDEWVQEMEVAGKKTGNKWVWLYYIIVMFIGNIFLLNMIIAIVIQEFRTLKAKRFHFALLNEAEKDWIQTQRIVMKFHPKKKYVITGEKNCIDQLYLFFESKIYIGYIIVSIILSVCALNFRLNHEKFSSFFLILDYFCIFLFTIEIILKLITYGKDFFNDQWNIFDFIIIILIIFTLPIDYLKWNNILKSTFEAVPLTLRFLRILKIIKLLSKDGRMRALLDTLLYELPSIANVGVFAGFIFLIYSNIGMNIFGSVPYRKKINPNTNFRNFLSSCLVLLQVTTGEDWNELMNELAYHDCRDPNSHIYKNDYYCITYNVTCWDEEYLNYTALSKLGRFSCGHAFSYAYFISFVIICPIFIMNLCLVMVVQGFEESVFENEGILPQEYMEKFVALWEKYDPKNIQVVKPHEFILILKELQPPIGYNYDRHLVSSNIKSKREKEDYEEFQRIVKEIKENEKQNKINAKKRNAVILNPITLTNKLKIENKKTEFESNISSHFIPNFNQNFNQNYTIHHNLNFDEPPSTYRKLNSSKEIPPFSHLKNISKVASLNYPSFTNEFPKNKIYISKNLKFYTSEIEVIQLMNRYNILAFDIYKKDHTGSGQNINFDKKEEDKYEKFHKHIDGHGADDLYIHYIDACFFISKYAVSIAKNIFFKKLRRAEVSKYSKKMWEGEYNKTILKQFFINIERREENSALSKKLCAKRIIDLYNFYKARKNYYNKIREIRENYFAKKAKPKHRRSSIFSSNIDYNKRISVIRNRRKSSINSNLKEIINYKKQSSINLNKVVNKTSGLNKKFEKEISINSTLYVRNDIKSNKSFKSENSNMGNETINEGDKSNVTGNLNS